MYYTKIFVDKEGETHFMDIEIGLELVEYAPPAPPLLISQFNPAKRYAFSVFPSGWFGDWHPTPRKQVYFSGWFGDWHPTPRKQVYFILSGKLEGRVSDGETRQFGPGSIVLVEDTTGKGHVTRVLGSEDVLSAVIHLEE